MRLFICTDPQDETALDPLLTVLGGYRLTIDVDRLIGGGDHRPRLQTAIQDCNAFIFALTPNTLRSSRCHWELAQATAFNRPILLVQLMPLVALPEGLRQLPHVDLDQDGGAEVLFALDALGATPPSFLAQLSQNRVRFGLVVILGIALALAGTNSPTRDLVHDTLLGVLAVADRTTGGDVAGTPIASPIPLFLLTPSPTAPPPTPAESAVWEGDILVLAGDEVGAMAAYESAIALNPQLAAAYVGRGALLRERSQLKGARADFDAALTLDGQSADAYAQRGALAAQQRQPAAALDDLNTALLLNPDQPLARAERGAIYAANGQYHESVADYSRALIVQPGNAMLYAQRGLSHRCLGEYPAAVSDFTAAATRDLDAAANLLARASNYACIGAPAPALAGLRIGEYDRALESAYVYIASALVERAQQQLEQGMPNAALADLTQALAFQPSYVGQAGLYAQRGALYLEGGRASAAVDDYAAAIDILPDVAEYWLGLAGAQVAANRCDEAAITLNQIGARFATLDSSAAQAEFARVCVIE